MSEASPRVSVIVPVYNAEATLRPCLEGILASEGVDFELIVVNDASTDASAEVALEFPCRLISLETNIMAANCRNLGVSQASGEILIFIDSDEVMGPDVLQRFVASLDAEPDIDAVVGSYAVDTPLPGFFSKFKNLAHHHTHQTADPEGSTLHSGLMAIRRPVFEACGGFEPAFGPASIEDIALGYEMVRRGHRIRFQPDIQLTHLKGYSLASLVRSDVEHRAIPWTALMIRDRVWNSDLNTKGGNVGSVALAWLLPVLALAAGLLAGPLAALGVVAGAVGLIGFLNADLLAASRRAHGAIFAGRALLFLPLMYFYQGAGLLLGIAVYLTGGSLARRREVPVPRYVVHEGT